MQITRGINMSPVKALVYGPEGIGKTTFASQWPQPLFIDFEQGSGFMDVARTPRPSSLAMLNNIIDELPRYKDEFKTVVFDTAGWMEMLVVKDILATTKSASIETVHGGFSKGYTRIAEEWRKLLDRIDDVRRESGMSMLFLAHSKTVRTNLPEENGEFDRYVIRMNEKASAPLREWVDLMLFVNFQVDVISSDSKTSVAKASGGHKRIMHTSHHACWDAKNRFGLEGSYPFEFNVIAKFVSEAQGGAAKQALVPSATASSSNAAQKAPSPEQRTTMKQGEKPAPEPPSPPDDSPAEDLSCLPKELRELMEMDGVKAQELKAICTNTYPIDTPLENYDPSFWTGKIIPNWGNKVMPLINKHRSSSNA